jgi:lipopolysaccharide export system permease protein
MRRVDRYIYREIFPIFLVSFLIVMVLFQANTYMFLAKNELTRNVPLLATIQLVLWETPENLNLVFPIAVALGTSLALSRISRESEITAIRAAGGKVMRVVWPALMFGVFAGLLNFLCITKLTPYATKRSMELKTSSNVLAGMGSFVSNRPLKMGNYTVSIGSVTKLDEDTLKLRDTLLVDRTDESNISVISSQEGTYQRGVWKFSNATSILVKPGRTNAIVSRSREFVINGKISLREMMGMQDEAKDLTISELQEQIKLKRQMGASTANDEKTLHKMFSIPMMCVIFSIITPFFSIKLAKFGGFAGVMISMVIVMAYYNVLVFCTDIAAKSPSADPVLWTWLPDIIFLAIGLVFMRKLE